MEKEAILPLSYHRKTFFFFVFPVPCETFFFHHSFLLRALPSQHNSPKQGLSSLDNEEKLTTLVYPLHFLSHFTSALEKIAPNGKS